MNVAHLQDMVRGWFVGDFEPTLFRTGNVEVGVKSYAAGDYEDWHYHRLATEITVIVSGEVEMNGRRYGAGEILVIPPREGTDFKALTEVTNVVVKLPGATDDKYLDRADDVIDAAPVAQRMDA
ncbi:hypothetical protein [Nocardioides sp. cx-173]|uniref:cupin domain-containing protein n=1 Tax=Nocardioides sp. cx-173 TaxID=2898796 RepID=UPI001E4F939C|nr:hypothetical protein [Nocardioides sp. cx-173]MCD4526934.1 hypothetical protein [Nocardioides sp. cx-173]UGB41278.1 hypothetical protein LQ940_18145 [Nocardioides sp. cx-173]